MDAEGYSKKAVPVAVHHGLTPVEAEAIRLYTDPLSPTYSKKKLSSDRAGADYTMWRKEGVNAAIMSIERDREERGEHVSTYLSHNAADAAIELVQQLSAGRDLEVVDPQSVVDDIVAKIDQRLHDTDLDPSDVERIVIGVMKEQRMLLGELNTANKVALMAVKERRQAVELILAYHMGTPQQKVQLEASEVKEQEQVLDLSQLSDEDLDQLRRGVEDVLRLRE